MVHLYCLRCNRPNDAEARYCSACGAGLFRKFCPSCHTINGVDAHFCQTCGTALPLMPGATAPEPPAQVQELTDVVVMPTVAPPTLPIVANAMGPDEQVPAAEPILALAPAAPAHRTVAFPASARVAVGALGVGAVVALSAAVLLWPSDPTPDAAAAPVSRAREPAARAGASKSATVEPVALKSLVSTATGAPLTATASVPPMRTESSTAVPLAGADRPSATAGRRPSGTADTVTAKGGIALATTTAAPAAKARPAQAAPTGAPSTYECTPEVHALGLCAPGASIIRRP